MKVLIAYIILFFLLASAAFAGEADKPLPELIKERAKVFDEIEDYKKENEKNVAAFNKLPAVNEHNVKTKILVEKWQKAQTRINELNAAIADKVTKDKK